MIKILLADDHAVVRKGLQLFIGYEDNMQLVAEASDGDELIEDLISQITDMARAGVSISDAPW